MNLADLPRHKASLTIEHNDHLSCYETVAEWCAGQTIFSWRDGEAQQRAINSDELWTMQWYPDTPVGFIAVAAPTLDELLAWAKEVEASL